MRKAQAQPVEPMEEVRNGVDYNEYNMSFLEKAMYAILAGAVLFFVGYVFYQHVVISSILALGGLFYPKLQRKKIIEKRKHTLTLQFKDMLYSLSSAVGAGNSVERALSVVLSDMQQQYNDPNAFIIKELELMVARVNMNRTIEEVFNDFAERSHVEDIETFASIFEIAKRTGGNLIEIIRSTTTIISDKIETQTEITTLLSGQQGEQKIVTVMPVALVLFMTKTSGGFMDPIFTTVLGRIIATGCLVVILVGTLWAKKIADIKI